MQRRRLIPLELSREQVSRLRHRAGLGQMVYAVAVPAAFLSAALSVTLCFLVAVYYVFPGRGVATLGSSQRA